MKKQIRGFMLGVIISTIGATTVFASDTNEVEVPATRHMLVRIMFKNMGYSFEWERILNLEEEIPAASITEQPTTVKPTRKSTRRGSQETIVDSPKNQDNSKELEVIKNPNDTSSGNDVKDYDREIEVSTLN